MAAGGNAFNVLVGPGRLYYAVLGTTEPTDASTALPSAWNPIGYTEAGTTVNFDIKVDPIEVAEEFDPVAYVNSQRLTSLDVEMAEATRRNLGLILGVPTTANSATAFTPPVAGTEVGLMIVWDKEDTPTSANTRWLFRNAKASGSISMKRQKAPAKTTFAVKFLCAKSGSSEAFTVWPGSHDSTFTV